MGYGEIRFPLDEKSWWVQFRKGKRGESRISAGWKKKEWAWMGVSQRDWELACVQIPNRGKGGGHVLNEQINTMILR